MGQAVGEVKAEVTSRDYGHDGVVYFVTPELDPAVHVFNIGESYSMQDENGNLFLV